MEGGKDGKKDGRNAEKYVLPLFFEKAADKNYMIHQLEIFHKCEQ